MARDTLQKHPLMLSSQITADATGQVYRVSIPPDDLSVGSWGGIFRKAFTSASTAPDSLFDRSLPYSSPSKLLWLKVSTLQKASQSDGSPFGTTTTRRASPSPLLSVVTSGWSASVRWMIRRSKAGIGSRANGSLFCVTCSAILQARD